MAEFEFVKQVQIQLCGLMRIILKIPEVNHHRMNDNVQNNLLTTNRLIQLQSKHDYLQLFSIFVFFPASSD
jgi:hypothetical protein